MSHSSSKMRRQYVDVNFENRQNVHMWVHEMPSLNEYKIPPEASNPPVTVSTSDELMVTHHDGLVLDMGTLTTD